MSLTDFQKAFLSKDLIPKDNVIDSATGSPVDWGALGGSVGAIDDVPGLTAALAALQPLDSDLTAVAALSTTSFGRGLLALADAAALGANHSHTGGTIEYPTLKPGTPTDDFNAALSGWTAVSTAGSFSLATCHGRAKDGSHLRMAWGFQNGFIYQAASNVDQEWIAGGVNAPSRTSDMFFGIALLDTSNNGVGFFYHSADNTCALGQIAAGIYNTGAVLTSGAWGTLIGTPTDVWLRMTRVGNVFKGYISLDGVNWNESTATITVTRTIARKAIGSFGNTNTTYYGQLYADWVHTV